MYYRKKKKRRKEKKLEHLLVEGEIEGLKGVELGVGVVGFLDFASQSG